MTFISQLARLNQSLIRPTDEIVFRRRRSLDRAVQYLRSCAVCTAMLPPIDFLCAGCWRTLGDLMNRGPSLKQIDYPIPTYSLLTWTPENEEFIRPLIYAFKGGHAALASEKLATLFLSEYVLASKERSSKSALVPAPALKFDHSVLWAQALSRQTGWPARACLVDSSPREQRQKELRAGERGLRRFVLREQFAKEELSELGAKRIVFADDVVTTGSTAMAAYMALGDPERFEVWSLVARPRLAAKQGAC